MTPSHDTQLAALLLSIARLLDSVEPTPDDTTWSVTQDALEALATAATALATATPDDTP